MLFDQAYSRDMTKAFMSKNNNCHSHRQMNRTFSGNNIQFVIAYVFG